MRLAPASGRSAPCVGGQTRAGGRNADLSTAPDHQKSVQFSVVNGVQFSIAIDTASR